VEKEEGAPVRRGLFAELLELGVGREELFGRPAAVLLHLEAHLDLVGPGLGDVVFEVFGTVFAFAEEGGDFLEVVAESGNGELGFFLRPKDSLQDGCFRGGDTLAAGPDGFQGIPSGEFVAVAAGETVFFGFGEIGAGIIFPRPLDLVGVGADCLSGVGEVGEVLLDDVADLEGVLVGIADEVEFAEFADEVKGT